MKLINKSSIQKNQNEKNMKVYYSAKFSCFFIYFKQSFMYFLRTKYTLLPILVFLFHFNEEFSLTIKTILLNLLRLTEDERSIIQGVLQTC